MKKRAYKTTDVKKVNVHRLQKMVEGHEIIFSVDVAKTDFVGCIMTLNKEVLITLKWKHPSESLLLLELILRDLRWHSLEVVMEPSGTYGDSLRALFLGHGIDVYRSVPSVPMTPARFMMVYPVCTMPRHQRSSVTFTWKGIVTPGLWRTKIIER